MGEADGLGAAPPRSPVAPGNRCVPTGAHAANTSITAATSRGILIGHSIVTVRSRRAGFRAGAFRLFGVFHRAGLADHRDLDLTGVLQRVLDLLCDVAGEPRRLKIVELLGLDHDPDLAARPDRERVPATRGAVRHAFELLGPLGVVRHDRAPSTGPRRAGGAGSRAP